MRYSKSWREQKKLTPETLLKRDVKQVLGHLGWFHFPILQGLGSYPGLCDIITCKQGRILFLELKSKKGKQSPKQKFFQENIENQGFTYLLIRDIDDLLSVFRDLGEMK